MLKGALSYMFGRKEKPASKKMFKFEKIKLGICAMEKKTKSKPMKEMLKRFHEDIFEITIFSSDDILNHPIEDWPVVEVLIAFYSTGFPTEKAKQYVQLRNPVMINDLEVDTDVLRDRRRVYKMLESQGINVPVHVLCERDDPTKENVIEGPFMTPQRVKTNCLLLSQSLTSTSSSMEFKSTNLLWKSPSTQRTTIFTSTTR